MQLYVWIVRQEIVLRRATGRVSPVSSGTKARKLNTATGKDWTDGWQRPFRIQTKARAGVKFKFTKRPLIARSSNRLSNIRQRYETINHLLSVLACPFVVRSSLSHTHTHSRTHILFTPKRGERYRIGTVAVRNRVRDSFGNGFRARS